VQTPEQSIVVDTGPDFRHQCLRAGLRHLDAVFFTHAHTDHIMGFDDLRRFTFGEDATLPIYATEATLAALERSFAFAFDREIRYPGYFKPDPKPLHSPVMLEGTEITPLPVLHARVSTVGYLFSRGGRKLLAYISDVKQIPHETMELIRGVDTFVVDCLRHRELPTHFNVEEAMAAIRSAAPRRSYLTHLCHELGHAEFEATLPPEIRIAYDGLRITIP
jgi:phosphoribosyl 1,2-cyclic phosphate phosphodiesterase